ncbi:MAG: hypothetical protein WCG25_03405 [bacterium]
MCNGVSGSSRRISFECNVVISQSGYLILIAHSMILIHHSNFELPVITIIHFLALFHILRSSRLNNFQSFLEWISINGSHLCKNIFATLSHSCNSIAFTHQAVFHIGLISSFLNIFIHHC